MPPSRSKSAKKQSPLDVAKEENAKKQEQIDELTEELTQLRAQLNERLEEVERLRRKLHTILPEILSHRDRDKFPLEPVDDPIGRFAFVFCDPMTVNTILHNSFGFRGSCSYI